MLKVHENLRVWTKDEIEANILANDRWLFRGILAIYKRQTTDEQSHEKTKYKNGVGFNAVDAKILSSFAIQLKTRHFLSEKQKYIARKKMKKYTSQLARIANNKKA